METLAFTWPCWPLLSVSTEAFSSLNVGQGRVFKNIKGSPGPNGAKGYHMGTGEIGRPFSLIDTKGRRPVLSCDASSAVENTECQRRLSQWQSVSLPFEHASGPCGFDGVANKSQNSILPFRFYFWRDFLLFVLGIVFCNGMRKIDLVSWWLVPIF